MSWFWFLVALVMFAWNAFLMHINSMQAADIRRLGRYIGDLTHRRRVDAVRTVIGGRQ